LRERRSGPFASAQDFLPREDADALGAVSFDVVEFPRLFVLANKLVAAFSVPAFSLVFPCEIRTGVAAALVVKSGYEAVAFVRLDTTRR